ncbi:MAG: SciE type virulence protein [Gammaproteobacteria bacterium]|nr:SciE type virulence protein [Gammaproteobacteria bacterium]
MNAREYYQAGQLDNAIKAIIEEVKKNPTDTNRRGFLSELLLISREWDRADKQLDMIGHQSPEAMMGIMLWRQMIRAGQARDQFVKDGRVPEVLEVPDDLVQHYLKASVLLRENSKTEALGILNAAEEARQPISGELDGVKFSDFRDLDDRAPGVLEVFTSNGKYYWIPFSRIISINFYKPESALDLVFRRAHLEINGDGPDGEVYMPATYLALPEEDREAFLLGRTTDWLGDEGEPVLGAGQKMFYVDEQAKTIMEMQEIKFDQ